MDSDSKDLINELPDPLLCHILSFLPTKEAASTSVLSRRWRHLLAFVHNLDFDDSVYLHPEERVKNPLDELGYVDIVILVNGKRKKLSTSFPDFVDRILDLQGNFPLHKVSLKIVDYHDPVDPDCVIPWIHNALVRGVSDLRLVMNLDLEFWLPSRIFLSATLVRLSLILGGRVDGRMIDVKDAHLPKLKSLYLESVLFEKEDIAFCKLLSGCPVLEELVMNDICSYLWKSCSVCVPTLKRLTFCWEEQRYECDYNPYSLTFDTPNLVYLEYTEVIADKYPKVNFGSLVEAKIDLRMSTDQSYKASYKEEASASELKDQFAKGDEENNLVGNATDFIMAICNVQTLLISQHSRCTHVLLQTNTDIQKPDSFDYPK